MRRTLALLLAVLVVSCDKAPPPGAAKPADAAKTSDAAATPGATSTPPASSRQYPLPDVQNVTQATVFRSSDNKDKDGDDLPPWKKVEIDVRLDQRPKVGEKITIVPLDVDIAPSDLRILKVTQENKSCDEKILVPWWALGLEPITGGPFFEVTAPADRREETPFDVCVIHPAVEFARQLRREQLTKEMLPEGIHPDTVTAAIDLTNDQRPDLLVAAYCCKDTARPARECDYTCGKEFKRTASGWKLMDEHGPC